MSALWPILLQFLFRLSFGVALAMALTPASKVTSGFYRVHLWMVMGFATFASLIAWTQADQVPNVNLAVTGAITVAVLSYLGAVIWLYERKRLGTVTLYLIAACSLASALMIVPWNSNTPAAAIILQLLAPISGGMLLGLTLTAMLLGHWYLNTPGMELAPLQRLILLLGGAIGIQATLSGIGLAMHLGVSESELQSWYLFLALRWLAGIVGTAVMAGMTWQTLKIPNTQSATGILYAGVILSFIGELTSQLLSVETHFPV